ncbi:MAG: hypothetical protein Q8M24_07560 [Pseudolabrys sp.]|nr:hypothetical protein [Pseudolabrys sp.]MDP2295307.1 hypothetical protein [Pseudolabrys sp.]
MNKFMKIAAAATMTGALALAVASPSEARDGRNAAAIGGFAAGAVVGAAVAGSNNSYYGRPGYYQRGYAYQPGYVYDEPAYAYEPRYAPSYDVGAVPAYPYKQAPRYYSRSRSAPCGGSPGSVNYRPCNNQ